MPRRHLGALILALALPNSTYAQGGDAHDRAVSALERVREHIGSVEDVLALGGVQFEASGALNQGAERQGRAPDSVDPSPFREVFAIDSEGRIAYEYRHDRIDGSWDWIREVVLAPDEWMITGPSGTPGQGWAVRFSDERFDAKRMGLLRRLPQALVEEALSPNSAVTGLVTGEATPIVSYRTERGEQIFLEIDEESGLLTAASTVIDAPTFGDAQVRWTFEEYGVVGDGVWLPMRYGVSIDDRQFTVMRVSQMTTEIDHSLFDAPEGVETPEARPAPADMWAPMARAAVREIGEGVYAVVNLRTGFHPIFMEFDEFVVAVDAPAGYRLLNEFPPGYVAHGATSSSISERYIELIKETVPDKPIRYVVLTHFHNDHAGGLRAFMAEGATIVVPSASADAVRAMARSRHTINPDRYARQGGPAPEIVAVDDEVFEISSGDRTLRVLPVGENPHTDGLLFLHVPHAAIVYEVDFVYPSALEHFPDDAHRAGAEFFVRWLDARGLDPEWVYTAHGGLRASREHLAKIRGEMRADD